MVRPSPLTAIPSRHVYHHRLMLYLIRHYAATAVCGICRDLPTGSIVPVQVTIGMMNTGILKKDSTDTEYSSDRKSNIMKEERLQLWRHLQWSDVFGYIECICIC